MMYSDLALNVVCNLVKIINMAFRFMFHIRQPFLDNQIIDIDLMWIERKLRK